MSQPLNYKHLYYFWAVAKEGGMTKAADRLGMAVQTVSAQVRELERALGYQLLKPVGRNVALTPAGEAAYRHAEHIFELGERLPDVLQQATDSPQVVLRVGISDGLPKLAIPRLLAPVLDTPHLRLECHEDEFDDLLADLALHRLDMILADRPAPPSDNVRVYNHALGQSPVQWLGTPALAGRWQQALALHHQDANLPHPLQVLPVLLPTHHAALRGRLNRWFEQQHIHPKVAGEFEDSALLMQFGATGMGVFPAPDLVRSDLEQRQGLVWLGDGGGVAEQFVLIGSERKVMHPLVKRVLESGLTLQ
jgi:LysR family transcriptional activator of nhaA